MAENRCNIRAVIVICVVLVTALVVACDPVAPPEPPPPLGVDEAIPTAAAGAIGAHLPTARGASPRIPVAVPSTRDRRPPGDAGARQVVGDGVPL